MATKAQKENQARFKAVQAEAKKLKAKNPKLAHTAAVKQAWAILYAKSGKTKAAPKKTTAKKKIGNVTLKKANYHKNDERYIIMNDGVEHLDGKPFFKERAQEIAKSLRKVKSKTKKIGAVKAKAPIKRKVAPKKKVAAKSYHKDTQSHNVSVRVMSGVSKSKIDYTTTINRLKAETSYLQTFENHLQKYILYKPSNAQERQYKKVNIEWYKKHIKECKEHIKELKKLI